MSDMELNYLHLLVIIFLNLDTEYLPFPQQLATSLFSFLYHLASYESGCEALVASGLIESLLKVVLWPGQDDHITVGTS